MDTANGSSKPKTIVRMMSDDVWDQGAVWRKGANHFNHEGLDAFAHEARAVFEALDTDGDGSLSPEEVRVGLREFGVEGDEVDVLFKLLDADGDGAIDLDEFIAGYGEYQVRRARR